MPRADHYPPDIMDRFAAFISAVNELKSHIDDWGITTPLNNPTL